MKRILSVVLTLVLVVGMFSVVSSAILYSASRNVDDSFFLSYQSGLVPAYEESGIFSPVQYAYSYGYGGPCSATTEVTLSDSTQEGRATVLIVGNYIVADDGPTMRALETVDYEEYEYDDYFYITASVDTVDSQYAVKTQFTGTVTEVSDGFSRSYELNLIAPFYYTFYGTEE